MFSLVNSTERVMVDLVVPGVSKNGDDPKKYQLIKDLCTLFIKFYLNFATDSWDIVLYMSYLSRVQKKNMSTRLFK